MSVQAPIDRGYLNLLSHLRESRPRIPLETLQAAICHYLVHLPSSQPTPTPLTASIIVSPLWHPLTMKTCLLLGSTFRLAVREKLFALRKKQRGLFDASLTSDLTSWSRGILSGLKDGDSLLRLTMSGGLHLGLNDLVDIKPTNRRLLRDVEETMVLAFAEATDSAEDRWAAEFKDSKDEQERRIELALLLASQYFNSVTAEALAALNLISLAELYLSAIDKGFLCGDYLRAVRDGFDRSTNSSVAITGESSKVGHSVDALLTSDNFSCIAYLCRLLSRIVSTLADTSFRTSKRRQLWDLLIELAQQVQSLASRVEEDWRSSPLAEVQSDGQLDEKTRKLTESIWTILKTQLFSSLMLQQAILDTILFLPPPPATNSSNQYSATYLTSTILDTLSSLSFVVSSFGGVTAGPSDASNGPSFPELKKVFYMSIDILATDVHQSEAFIYSLVQGSGPNEKAFSTANNPFISAKRSFALSCIEQFISILDDAYIERVILPFCELHLNDPSDRQTYEAAHSVMLSIFATHAEKGASPSLVHHSPDIGEKGKGVQRTSLASDVGLARRLVPGYAQILIENAREGGLTTSQLRLAYAALVRSSSTGKTSHRFPGKPDVDEAFAGDPALAWFCVEQLLRALANADTKGQTHLALSLTVISCIPNVGPYLLPRTLEEVERIVDDETDVGRKRLLVENVFEEILERVGDAERKIAMTWWFECVKKWESCFDSRTVEQQVEAKL